MLWLFFKSKFGTMVVIVEETWGEGLQRGRPGVALGGVKGRRTQLLSGRLREERTQPNDSCFLDRDGATSRSKNQRSCAAAEKGGGGLSLPSFGILKRVGLLAGGSGSRYLKGDRLKIGEDLDVCHSARSQDAADPSRAK